MTNHNLNGFRTPESQHLRASTAVAVPRPRVRTYGGVTYQTVSNVGRNGLSVASTFVQQGPARRVHTASTELHSTVLGSSPIYHSPTEATARAVFPHGNTRPPTHIPQPAASPRPRPRYRYRYNSTPNSQSTTSQSSDAPAATPSTTSTRAADDFSTDELTFMDHLLPRLNRHNLEIAERLLTSSSSSSSSPLGLPFDTRREPRDPPIDYDLVVDTVLTALFPRNTTGRTAPPSPANAVFTRYDRWEDMMDPDDLPPPYDEDVAGSDGDETEDEERGDFQAEVMGAVGGKRSLLMKIRSKSVEFYREAKKVVKKGFRFLSRGLWLGRQGIASAS